MPSEDKTSLSDNIQQIKSMCAPKFNTGHSEAKSGKERN